MVEIFVNRAELMPSDESTEQHQQRQKEENSIIEIDRESETGLFKGCFRHQDPIGTLVFNEEDHLYRCGRCGHEYQGGPICDVCELEFDPDEDGVVADDMEDRGSIGSLDSMEMFDIEHDLDDDVDQDDIDSEADFNSEEEDPNSFIGNVDIVWSGSGSNGPGGMYPSRGGFSRVPHPLSQVHNVQENGWGSPRSSQGSSDDDENDEDEGSLRDFVEHDEDHDDRHTDTSHISINSRSASDSEDEEGPIRGAVASARRQGRRAYAAVRRHLGGGPSESSDTGDAEDDVEENTFQRSGWSPLDNGTESEDGEHQPIMPQLRRLESSEDSSNVSDSDSDSDTDTIGNHQSDDDDTEEERDANKNGSSGQFRFEAEREALRRRNRIANHSIYHVEGRGSSVDREGDVEMSVSPTDSSDISVSSEVTQRGRGGSVEYLGTANAVHDVDDSDSDVSPQPARRRRQQPSRAPRISPNPEYDPRISSLFAQHQSDLRDVTQRESPYFEDPHPEPSRDMASFATAVHQTPQIRRLSPLRRPAISHYHAPRPSLPSIIDRIGGPVIMPSSSTRPNRVQRQYTRR